jgi:hypothetical protein
MSFFTPEQMARLEQQHKEVKEAIFVEKYATIIRGELDYISEVIRVKKDSIFTSLLDSIYEPYARLGGKYWASMTHCYVFDFSKVGKDALFTTAECGTLTVEQYARCERKDSFRWYDEVSFEEVWRSKGFLEKLAKKLDLPKTMSLEIRKEQVWLCANIFHKFGEWDDDEYDIPQHRVSICVVYTPNE